MSRTPHAHRNRASTTQRTNAAPANPPPCGSSWGVIIGSFLPFVSPGVVMRFRTADAPSPPPPCDGTPSPAHHSQYTAAYAHGARWNSPPAHHPQTTPSELSPASSQVPLPQTEVYTYYAMPTHCAHERRRRERCQRRRAHPARRYQQHQRYRRQVTRLYYPPTPPLLGVSELRCVRSAHWLHRSPTTPTSRLSASARINVQRLTSRCNVKQIAPGTEWSAARGTC